MPARRIVALGLTALLLIVLGGCSSGSSGSAEPAPPPNPTELLTESAQAMASVTTAHFTIEVTGQLPSLTVQSAEGVLTKKGDAQGTAKITEVGQLVEVEFVLVNSDLYLKGPTGGFAKIPAALAGQVYDPSAILNPDKGVAAVMKSVQDATLVSSDGTSAVVSGTVPKDVAAGLVPGISSDVKATFTIARPSSQLTEARFELTGSDGQPAAVRVQLSQFNEPVTVNPPA